MGCCNFAAAHFLYVEEIWNEQHKEENDYNHDLRAYDSNNCVYANNSQCGRYEYHAQIDHSIRRCTDQL